MSTDIIARGQAAAALAKISRANTAVIFGDSITGHDGDIGSTTPTVSSSLGYFTTANAILGNPLKLLNNAGVSGDTTTGMLARVGPSVLAYAAGYCIVLGGQNDGGNSMLAATSIANLTAIYDALRANGIFVIACSVMPATADADTIRTSKAQINRAIRAYVQSHNGCAYADFALAIADPATGTPLSLALSDGTHPFPAGAMLLGRCLAEILTPLVAPMQLGISSEFGPYNYNPNPFAQGANASGSGGALLATVTGTAPNAWSGRVRNTGSGVLSSVSRTGSWRADPYLRVVASFAALNDGVQIYFGGDDIGGKGRYDITWAATTAKTYGDRIHPVTPNGYHFFCMTPGTTGSSEPTWPTAEGSTVTDGTMTWIALRTPQVGDRFYAEVDLAFSSLTNGACPTLQVDCLNNNGNASIVQAQAFFKDLSGSTDGYSLYLPPTMRLRTPVITIPSFGSNALRYLRAIIGVYGQAGGGVTMDVSRASIIRVAP